MVLRLMEFIVSLTSFSVYDITKRSSFLSIQRWIEEVRRYTTLNVMLILVGNKCDLESLREVISLSFSYVPLSPWLLHWKFRWSLPKLKPCANTYPKFYLWWKHQLRKIQMLTTLSFVWQPSWRYVWNGMGDFSIAFEIIIISDWKYFSEVT